MISNYITLFWNWVFTQFPFSCYSLLSWADTAYKKQYGLQDPATQYFQDIIDLHHDLMLFMVMGAVFVLYILISTIYEFSDNLRVTPAQDIRHHTLIEVVWTISPALILLSIAVPSFVLLYSMEENFDACIHLKILGNQWYWTYECDDFVYITGRKQYNLLRHVFPAKYESCKEHFFNYMVCNKVQYFHYGFDAVLIPDDDILYSKGKFARLLTVDNILVLPSRVPVRCTVTATDVIHSWTVPSFGVKLDACPGRLNSALFTVKRTGIYYGQCSEICGVKHAFMPIQVNVVRVTSFFKHVVSNL